MSTHKNIDLTCLLAGILAIALTLFCLFGTSSGLIVTANAMGYESRLFDTETVHTVDIVMDDWDSFIETCTNEEYSSCTVVIDGEKYGNVGLRAKGNTSLSNVASMGSERYSFKLEFDQYETGRTYHGLDKLCLNNIIQDNTYMKDYLAYRMMAEFGVDAPLCSYVYITVNGADWGLYLAVEGIEDSFLERNYGTDYGELYKPDSLSFGGGRGNGKNFNMDDFDFEALDMTMDLSSIGLTQEDLEILGLTDADLTAVKLSEIDMEKFSQIDTSSLDLSGVDFEMHGGPGMDGQENAGEVPQMPGKGGNMPDMSELPKQQNSEKASNADSERPTMLIGEMPEMPSGEMPNMPNMGGMNFDAETGASPEGNEKADAPENGEQPTAPENSENATATGLGSRPDMGDKGGFGMGSSDVKLQYIDDDADSYTNIFGSAKTDITESDEKRLIASLKRLSSYEDLENVLDIDEVLRYFVVHNFTVNGDSYTGSMIHNYYLYEEDGKMSMIPWDYNLAYGTFQGNNASSSVNDSIDEVLDDRPMQAWIFSSETYTQQYHELYEEFLTTVDVQGIIEDAYTLIAPYVAKDPTAFCTYEEFETGVQALKTFCNLRTNSVLGQLAGTIPSTDDAQSADSSALIGTGDLNISDMGTMSMGGGGFGGEKTESKAADNTAEKQRPESGGKSFERPSGDFPGKK